jgi:RimJ/RimL family protein N-acetyltransferase
VLRPLCEADIRPFVSAFEDDRDLGLLLGFERDPGEDYMRERLRDERRKLREGRSVAFAIADPDSGAFVGEVLLHTFDWQHSRAAVGIWLRPEGRRRGIGTCALRLICHYGFSELGLLRLELTTMPDNEATIRVAERVGFTSEGVMRSYTWTRGKRRDLTLLSLLPGELR